MNSIHLSNGLILAFAEYGDLGGRPVFFFHGIPGSRFFRPPDEITQRMGVHLICMDRPGYGESSFQRARRLLDWPGYVTCLADHLNIGTFSVASHSGGGPYALACSYALPERVRSAAIVSSLGPVGSYVDLQQLIPVNRIAFKFGQHIPWWFLYLFVRMFFRKRAADPGRELDRGIGHRPLDDDRLLKNNEIRQICIKSEEEAFRQGLRGLAWDIHLVTSTWGFRLEGIRVPVHIWHGTSDNMASISMACQMAANIPRSSLTVFENEAHLLLFPHWDQILLKLIVE
jgi:pimeloyl-ACP methyl ester carboxylesterase